MVTLKSPRTIQPLIPIETVAPKLDKKLDKTPTQPKIYQEIINERLSIPGLHHHLKHRKLLLSGTESQNISRYVK
jgi:hypothetical protein